MRTHIIRIRVLASWQAGPDPRPPLPASPPLQVGTIFGVWPGDKLTGITGRQQAAAGMGIYGPRTVFCIALKVRMLG